jgi:predicted phosphodiesterase
VVIAAFSDVHGNWQALEAVLADIRSRAADVTICLGDMVGYGAFPNEVIEAIREAGIPAVAGNYDDGVGFDREECGCAYTTPEDIARGDQSLKWTQAHVTPENNAWLRALPRELRLVAEGKRVLCVHGSPRRINEYLYEDRPEKSLAHVRRAGAESSSAGIPTYPITGASGLDLVNVGSAGKPKDGDPRVGYALIR